KGTPQGGPLSPILANIYLNEFDKELTRRGHHFVRYADDCNIYVKSQRAGERVMRSITQFLEKRLKVKVNPDKTKVGSPLRLKFQSLFKKLGNASHYSFSGSLTFNINVTIIRIAHKVVTTSSQLFIQLI